MSSSRPHYSAKLPATFFETVLEALHLIKVRLVENAASKHASTLIKAQDSLNNFKRAYEANTDYDVQSVEQDLRNVHLTTQKSTKFKENERSEFVTPLLNGIADLAVYRATLAAQKEMELQKKALVQKLNKEINTAHAELDNQRRAVDAANLERDKLKAEIAQINQIKPMHETLVKKESVELEKLNKANEALVAQQEKLAKLQDELKTNAHQHAEEKKALLQAHDQYRVNAVAEIMKLNADISSVKQEDGKEIALLKATVTRLESQLKNETDALKAQNHAALMGFEGKFAVAQLQINQMNAISAENFQLKNKVDELVKNHLKEVMQLKSELEKVRADLSKAESQSTTNTGVVEAPRAQSPGVAASSHVLMGQLVPGMITRETVTEVATAVPVTVELPVVNPSEVQTESLSYQSARP